MESEMIQPELVPSAIERGLKRVRRNRKHPTVERTRQLLQDLDRPRGKADQNIDELFGTARVLDRAQQDAAFLEVDIGPLQASRLPRLGPTSNANSTIGPTQGFFA